MGWYSYIVLIGILLLFSFFLCYLEVQDVIFFSVEKIVSLDPVDSYERLQNGLCFFSDKHHYLRSEDIILDSVSESEQCVQVGSQSVVSEWQLTILPCMFFSWWYSRDTVHFALMLMFSFFVPILKMWEICIKFPCFIIHGIVLKIQLKIKLKWDFRKIST